MGSINLHMRHFPEKDPQKLDNSAARSEIDQQIQDYLSKGGTITQCDSSEMRKIPAKQTWDEARQYKRRNYSYGAGKHVRSTDSGKVRVLRWPAVKERVQLSRSHVDKMVRAGRFPQPIKLSERALGWLESDVVQWIRDRADQRS